MANYQSNVMKKQTGSNAGKLLPSEFGGRVRLVHGSIVPEEAYESGSVLELARLPKGARLLPVSQIHFEAGQSASMTIAVGDSGDAERYLPAETVGAAAVSVDLNGNALGSYTLPAEDVITATVGGAALAAEKTIAFDLFYVVD